jgi:hypothetical protein
MIRRVLARGLVDDTYITPVVPDGTNHEIDAGTSDPSLHTIPDTGHGSSVKDRPQRTPDAERCSVDDGE